MKSCPRSAGASRAVRPVGNSLPDDVILAALKPEATPTIHDSGKDLHYRAAGRVVLRRSSARAAEKHSDAEVLLFETDHLRKINRPVTLRYNFKYYVFTLSDSLPGSVYQIRAVVPATDGGKTSLMEESLTFDRADEPTGKQ